MHEHGGGWAGATSVQSADDDDPRNFVTTILEVLLAPASKLGAEAWANASAPPPAAALKCVQNGAVQGSRPASVKSVSANGSTYRVGMRVAVVGLRERNNLASMVSASNATEAMRYEKDAESSRASGNGGRRVHRGEREVAELHSITLRGRAQRVRAKLRTEGQSGTVPMVVHATSPSPARRVPRPWPGVGGTSTRLRLAKIETLIALSLVQTLPIASREHGRSVSAT